MKFWDPRWSSWVLRALRLWWFYWPLFFLVNPTRASDENPIRGKPPETYVGLGISLCNSSVGKMSRRSAGIVWGFAFSFSKPQVVLRRKTCSCHGTMWKPRWKVTPCLPSSALILVCCHGALLTTNTNHVLGDVLLLWKSTQGIIDPQGLCHPHVPCQWLPWAMVTLDLAFVSFWGQNLLSPREQTSRHIYEEISRSVHQGEKTWPRCGEHCSMGCGPGLDTKE